MEKEFIPYKLAVKLKALGFDEPCFGSWWFNPSIHKLNEEELQIIKSYYFGLPEYCILAPTFSQAFRWLLKEYNLYAIIIPTVTMHWTFKTMTVVEDIVEVPPYDHVDANDYGTREEAELACLVKLIEIVETRTK